MRGLRPEVSGVESAADRDDHVGVEGAQTVEEALEEVAGGLVEDGAERGVDARPAARAVRPHRGARPVVGGLEAQRRVGAAEAGRRVGQDEARRQPAQPGVGVQPVLEAYGIQLRGDQIGTQQQAGGEHEVGRDGHAGHLCGDGRAEVGLVTQHEVRAEVLDDRRDGARHASGAPAGEVLRELHLARPGAHHRQRCRVPAHGRPVVGRVAGGVRREALVLDPRHQAAGPGDRDLVAGVPRGAGHGEERGEVPEPADEGAEEAHVAPP